MDEDEGSSCGSISGVAEPSSAEEVPPITGGEEEGRKRGREEGEEPEGKRQREGEGLPDLGAWADTGVKSVREKPPPSSARAQPSAAGQQGGVAAFLSKNVVEAARLAQVQRKVAGCPMDIHSQLDLLKGLQDAVVNGQAEKEELHLARERMCESVAPTAGQYARWVQEAATDAADSLPGKERVLRLLRRACEDWPVADLMLAQCQTLGDVLDERIAAEGREEEEGAAEARFREVMEGWEEAVTAAGADFAQGHLLWAAYREWLAEELPEGPELRQREGALWKRQLSIPSAALTTARKEFECWAAEGEDAKGFVDAVTRCAMMAAALSEERKPFESKIASLGTGRGQVEVLVAGWEEYATFERKRGDAGRVAQVYTRALRAVPSSRRLWLEAVRSAVSAHTGGEASRRAVLTAQRCVRVLPNCLDAWVELLRALEVSRRPFVELREAAIRGYSAPLSSAGERRVLLLELMGAGRRAVAASLATLEEVGAAAEASAKALVQAGDGTAVSSVVRLWHAARRAGGQEVDGQGSVEEALAAVCGGATPELWIEWARGLETSGNIAAARQVLTRGTRALGEGACGAVAEEWIALERAHGTARQLDAVREGQRRTLERFYREAAEAAGRVAKEEEKGREDDGRSEDEEDDAGKLKQHARRERQKEAKRQAWEERKKEQGMEGPGEANLTVFLWNLPFSATDKDIVAHMGDGIRIHRIRIILDGRGVSKGFAYVEMEDTESVEAALK
eukprot:Hpha_TRINITY_DN14439_c0_g1::TRINITY_DN14439_c0_g1_i1::g.157639::m.157639